VTHELALVGLVAVVFGLGSYYATGAFALFNAANLAIGAAALLAALASGARGLGSAGGPLGRRLLARGALRVAAALGVAVGLERAAARAEVRFDWTFERRYELSPATRKALHELQGPLEALLFYDPLDPRRRQTRLLLESLEREGDVRVRELAIDAAEDEVDRYEVPGSNSVVLVVGDRFETVDRPTEGALYEALYRLRARRGGTLVFLTGEGEGDLARTDPVGYSGLAAALETEGYALRSVVSAALDEVPEEAAAVFVVTPRRRLLPGALGALRRYLLRGGRLVALLEPGVDSGVEDLLAEFGMRSPDALVVDPASAPLDEAGRGVSPLIHNYETHPATRGLDPSRMAVFHGARAFELRKPQPEDAVQRTALSSPRAWLSPDLSLLESRAAPPVPDGARQGYQALAAAGRYRRERGETRIAVFGDGDFASNRYLRALYNLDLLLNAVHWTTEQEPEITLRPKLRTPLNFPIPLQNTLRALYGVGLAVPELMLLAGGLVWLRRRSA
jgi:hypothetical protein